MWNVNPAMLCNKHLAGEHLEIHMFVGSIIKGISLEGYIDGGLVEVHNLVKRHDALAAEFIARGLQHKSPLPEFTPWIAGVVDVERSLRELTLRCSGCSKRIDQSKV